MGGTSKDLLHLEHKHSSTPSLESTLLVCNRKGSHTKPKKPNRDEKPSCESVPKSQVLDKVKDFLGVISEANKRLQLDAKDSAQDYDIEVLTGNESEVIEMDLMLGITDLHTPEAVGAAEAAIAGKPS
ncbi:DVA-1 polyprotein [Melia azedarach]|uniref:DVA-1 polyprotein n=1 Tax=Melia azedarach TaxID=155640 RepID=A0ACC1XYR7_MELAZ|nr:DVA-1 polyprotein [Melia azedarach]